MSRGLAFRCPPHGSPCRRLYFRCSFRDFSRTASHTIYAGTYSLQHMATYFRYDRVVWPWLILLYRCQGFIASRNMHVLPMKVVIGESWNVGKIWQEIFETRLPGPSLVAWASGSRSNAARLSLQGFETNVDSNNCWVRKYSPIVLVGLYFT